MQFKPRQAQNGIINYTQGLMGIKAVPGSGKTYTLSYLAARLIAEERVRDDQEVLIVTLVNSAVENFSNRIATFIQSFGLLPHTGYRVRTLHGLAHDLVRERPDLAGLSDNFQIADERETSLIISNIVSYWLQANPKFIERYTNEDQEITSQLIKNWEILLADTATSFIRLTKDHQASPQDIRRRIESSHAENDFLQFGLDVFEEYHRALHYRSAIDFDDLIRLALQAIESDNEFLMRLRDRWPYILEDEAQDSSRLQEKILASLAGTHGNWVRVGDPNQAIFETFTTAHPKYLIQFIDRPEVEEQLLPNSGRSTMSIISLANHLIDWSHGPENPNPDLRGALTYPIILPTPKNDPQPNPVDQPDKIFLYRTELTPDKELQTVARSLSKWIPQNPDKTVAVLVPRNERGAKLVDVLKKYNIHPVELLRSSASTRQTADILANVLKHLSEPTKTRHLADLYRKLKNLNGTDPSSPEIVSKVSGLIKNHNFPEKLIWPDIILEWSEQIEPDQNENEIQNELDWFCNRIRRWHKAATLPIDQLILTVSQDIFSLPVDLALAHKLALSLEMTAQNHPDWYLPQFATDLQEIADNRRKFYGFTSEDTGFDPAEHKGKVVVSTIHKAKGLEWDRVYLISVNRYDFPFGNPGDSYIGEKWFVREQINIEEETLARLKALLEEDWIGLHLEPGEATDLSRIEYARERLRLLYVGITRAKSELVITWNTGKRGNNQPAVPLLELIHYWSEKHGNTE